MTPANWGRTPLATPSPSMRCFLSERLRLAGGCAPCPEAAAGGGAGWPYSARALVQISLRSGQGPSVAVFVLRFWSVALGFRPAFLPYRLSFRVSVLVAVFRSIETLCLCMPDFSVDPHRGPPDYIFPVGLGEGMGAAYTVKIGRYPALPGS